MRPCSTTHHSDFDQRYVELALEPDPNGESDRIQITTPPTPQYGPTHTARGSVIAPHGWYMAFLVTTEETWSVAKWVVLQ